MIKFYSTNLVDEATITATNENALFPASNIQHHFRTKVFRSTTNSDSIVFDFGETSDADTVIIVPDPLQGFGVSTVTIEFNGTNSWGAPAYSTSVTIDNTHGFGIAEFATKSYRFARLVLTSTLGYCEISKVFIGEKIEFSSGTGIELGWSYQDDETSIIKKNAYGQRFVDVRARQKKISFGLKTLNKDELDQVFELYDDKGETKPFFMKLGDTTMINDPDRFSGMFYLNNVPQITNKAFGLYDLSMSLEEAM
jgi:hypothetical protein